MLILTINTNIDKIGDKIISRFYRAYITKSEILYSIILYVLNAGLDAVRDTA